MVFCIRYQGVKPVPILKKEEQTMTEAMRRKHTYMEQLFNLAALEYDFSQGLLLHDHFYKQYYASLDG
jgi:hypothetical protein